MLLDIMKNRRSVRKYNGEHIADEKIDMVLKAGLLSASSRGKRSWEFIVVRNQTMLDKMSECRQGSALMLKDADAAIVVLGNSKLTDVWTEDCSIAMSNMHIMADSIGLGSCWIQGRLREAADGRSTEEYLRELLGFPENMRLEAVLSLGMPKDKPTPHSENELCWDKVHNERY